MESDTRYEWGAVLLGFLGFFLAAGFLFMGMMPAGIFVIPLLLAILVIALIADSWELLGHHEGRS